MNKLSHRIIFNKARGILMAVAESAGSHSCGEGSRKRRGSPFAGPVSFTLTPGAIAILLFATGTMGLSPHAEAQIVANRSAPVAQQPGVLNAGNGVPLVNIQTPSAAGVSRNNYSQFDVQTQGAILNNSRTDVQTVQGGWVQGNPWLATGSARVILNEVNASSPSAINGYVEVAGQRAEVIIANPNGINVSGGGFINANRVTLTTGTAQFNGAGGIDSYSVSQGQISISGQGLNTSTSDYTDLISRSLQLNAGIWAKNLKVTTGANQVNAANTTATPIAGSGAAPAFAIDSSALGGMYANQIILVGTDKGVGVRNIGQIGASVGNVLVTVDGLLTNQGIISSIGHTQIDAQGGIENSGTIYAQGNARLSTQGNIANSATIAAQGDTTLLANGPAGQISSASGSLIAAGLTPSSTLSNAGNLSLTADADIIVSGQLAAGDSLGLSGGSLSLTGATIGGGSVTLLATAGNLDASLARITAFNTLAASTRQTLRTDGARLAANQLDLQAHNLSNRGGTLTHSGGGALSLVIPGSIDNTDGVIASNAQTLTLTTGGLDNTNGSIQHAGNGGLDITASQRIDNTGGTIASSTDATLNVAQLINSNGYVGSGRDLRLTIGSLSGAGRVMAGRDGNIDLQGDYAAGNLIAANRNLTIGSTGSFINQATLQAGNNLTIQAADINNDNVDQSSSLLAGGTLSTTSSTFGNTGTVIAGSLSIKATQSIINHGPKALIGATDSAGILELLAPVIQNRDDATTADSSPQTTIIGQGKVILAGGKDANGAYTAGDRVLNQSALIQSAGDLEVHADTLTNTRRILTAGSTFADTASISGSVYWTEDDPNVPGGRYVEPPHGGHWNSLYYGTDYTTVTARNSIEQISPEAQILVGSRFTPAVNTLQNYWSKVNAQGDIVLNGVSLDQDSWRGAQSLQERTTSSGVYNYKTYQLIPWTVAWGPEITYAPVPAYASSFTANGSLGGSGNSINNPVGSSPLNLPGIHAALPQNPSDILSLPTGSLYHVNTSPTSHYLVESNPAFANRSQWLGSDAYLSVLGYDPNTVQKRLGDNYYEQQLVRQQVLALSGNAVAAGYASSQAQFERLYADGARLAKELKLPIGAHLSAEQAAALTSNVVILETREVTTPSGRQQVLVPIVYLAHIQPGDLQANGPLIAANDIGLFDSKGFGNQGAVIAGNSLSVTMAKDASLNNTGGTLQAGGLLQLGSANGDIDLTSARVKASDLTIVSGKDLILSTTSRERTTVSPVSTRTQTDLGRTASIEVSHNADLATAGDFTQNAGQISVGGNLNANIGGSYNLGTVAQTDHQTADYKRSRGTSVKTDITRVTQQTSSIEVGGDASLVAGRDINTRGAQITGDGNLALKAGGDINLGAAENSLKSDMAFQHSQSGLLSSSKTKIHDQSEQTNNVGTTLSGNVSTLAAGHDINVTGSNVVSTEGTSLAAQNDIKIVAASDTYRNNRTEQNTKSGLMGSGGFGITIGTRQQTDDQKGTTTVAVGSTIGSTDGSVVLQAGQKYAQQGSDVLAPKGDIAITGKQVAINEARETTRNETERKLSQSGLTLALSSPVITALQTARQMNKASSQTSDARMKVLAAANTGMAAASAYDAINAGQGSTIDNKANQMPVTNEQGQVTGSRDASTAERAGGINLSISIGGSQSKSKTVQNSDSGHASKVSAGGDVVIVASGAGKESDLTLQGSAVKAGHNVLLAADDEIDLLAGRNTADQKSTNSSASGAIGISIGTGGFGVTLSASGARGKADGNDVTYDNTHVEAGQTLTLQSGGDTRIQGAVARAEQIQAKVGGDLEIESLQDTSNFKSSQQSIGGSVTVGVGVSGSFSASNGKVNSTYANVAEQSGLKAGDGGFQVAVKGDTDLKGAVISSTDKAVQEEKNTFQTGGALSTSDLRNTADYSADSVGFTVGTSQANDGHFKPAGNSAGIGSDSGHASSTTQAGISGIAGNKDVRTGDAETGINKIFDADKVQADINAQVLITQTFGAQASKLIGDYAKTRMDEARALQEQAAKESDPDRIAQLKAQAQNIVDQWGDQGSMRLLAHTVVGGLTGGVGGAAGAASSTLAAPELAKALNDAGINPDLTKALTAAASTTLGGLVGGTAGAGAAFNEVTNNFLSHQLQSERANLRKKIQSGKYLSEDDLRRLKALDEIDQRSDELLSKWKADPTSLSDIQKQQLASYLNIYAEQEGSIKFRQLIGPNASQTGAFSNYGFPYAGTKEAQDAYLNAHPINWLIGRGSDYKNENREIYDSAKTQLLVRGIHEAQADFGNTIFLSTVRLLTIAYGAYQFGYGGAAIYNGDYASGAMNVGLGTLAIYGANAARSPSTSGAKGTVAEGSLNIAKPATAGETAYGQTTPNYGKTFYYDSNGKAITVGEVPGVNSPLTSTGSGAAVVDTGSVGANTGRASEPIILTSRGVAVTPETLATQGTSKLVGDFRGLQGATVDEIISRVPAEWTLASQEKGLGIRFIDELGVERLRLHGPGTTAPAGSNSASGWTLRVHVPGTKNSYYDNFGNVVGSKANEGHIPIYGNPKAGF